MQKVVGSNPISRLRNAELYRGARLAAVLEWTAEHDPELNELEREFLEESRAAGEREAGPSAAPTAGFAPCSRTAHDKSAIATV
jgi:hypothetical protein